MNLEQFDAQQFSFLLNQSKENQYLKESDLESSLPLPEKFNILYDQTKSLISTLKAYAYRRRVSTLPKVREVIERQTKHTFNQVTLCKCVRTLPEGSINLQWQEDNRRNMPHQLHIFLVSGEPVNRLFEYSKNYLTDIVKAAHSKFLQSIHEREPKEIHVWHHKFDLNSVPDIVPIELKPPEIKQQISLLEALKPKIQQKLSASEIVLNEPERQVPNSCKNLNSYFEVVKKIQEKVSLNQTLMSIGSNKQNEDILKIADIFNITFSSQKKRSVGLKELITKVKQNQAFNSYDNNKLLSLADQLISKSNGYFTKLHLSGNDYIKIDEKRSYQSVRGPIYKAVMAIDA